MTGSHQWLVLQGSKVKALATSFPVFIPSKEALSDWVLGKILVFLPIWQILECLDPPIQLQVDRAGDGERRHESWSLSSPSPSLDILKATPCPQVPLETLAALSAEGVGKEGEGDLKSARECQREEESRAERVGGHPM